MPFTTQSSRITNTALRTEAQLRAAIARLVAGLKEDKESLNSVLTDLDVLLAAARREAVAGEAVSVGDVFRISVISPETVVKARANAVGTSDVCGVCTRTAASGGITEYCPLGVVEKPSWGLSDAIYYLSASTAGLLTTTAPSSVGQIILPVGVAVSSNELLVNIGQGVLL